MTAQFMDTLFLGLLTYLGHSTVFLALGLMITGVALLKNHALKEMILRFALFGALITTPLHLSGAFDPFFQPINIPEETLKSEPAPLGLIESTQNEVLPATTPPVTTVRARSASADAGTLVTLEAEQASTFTLANIVLMLWALFGAAFLFQLGYLIVDLKVQLSGRQELTKGRAVSFVKALAKKAGIATPHLSTKADLAGPFCLGTGEIVLPAWAEDLPDNQLKAMLAHEVAHIMRADPSWVLAARIVQSVFFFQPLNIFAARRLSELSEFACDAWAGKVCGSGMPLAECLAECAKRHLGKAPSALGAAMATKRSPIVERTQLLLAGIREYSKPASALSKVAVLSAFVIGGTMIPVFAFDEIDKKAEEDALHLEEEALHLAEAALEAEEAQMALEEQAMLAAEEAMEAEEARMVFEEEAMVAAEAALEAEEARIEFEEEAMLAAEEALEAEEAAMALEEQVMIAAEEAMEAEEAQLAAEEKELESFKEAMATSASTSSSSSSSSSHIIESNNGKWDIKTTNTRDGVTIKIRAEGRFESNADETGFSSMTKKSYMDITETKGGTTRRVRFESDGNQIDETYWLNGNKTSKDAAMTQWVAEVIPAMYRQTGLDVERRTKRIYARGGTDAVINEIGLIRGSYGSRVYAENLTEIGTFNDAQVERLIASVKDRQGSYDLRQTLTAIGSNVDLSKNGWRAFAEGILEISGSYDRRETLVEVADGAGDDAETRHILLKAAHGVSGDYDKRETLLNMAGKFPKDTETMQEMATVAKTISGSYDLRVTLSTLAERGGYDEAGWLALMDAITEISGDYDTRETLIAFAEEMPRTPALEAKYRELLETIGGDYDREQAEEALE